MMGPTLMRDVDSQRIESATVKPHDWAILIFMGYSASSITGRQVI